MKTRIWLGFLLTVVLAGFMLSMGCASETEKPKTTEILPGPAATNAVPVAAASTDAEPLNKIEPAPVVTSPGIDEVIKLAQSHVDEGVILAYVENSPVAYDPSVEEILYLNDIGLPTKVISAMISHGRALREKSGQTPETMSQPVAPSAPQAPVAIQAPQASVAAPTYAEAIPAAYSESAPQVAVQEPQPVTVNYFYQTLSPYGSWMEVPDYGWCWQPTAMSINSDWRPYGDCGRWLYTDNGWYWQSDYSWGWAPFHYGRWFRHQNYGWMWAPDTVWGPSWVCWRSTPVYCGWAPLPPGAFYSPGFGFSYYGVHVGDDFGFGLSASFFTFVHYRHFSDRNPWRYHAGDREAHDLYGHSAVRNHYFKGPNGAVINEGVGRDTISRFSRTEIRKVAVRDLPPAAGKIVRPDRLERDGKSLVIYRPNPQSAPALKPGIRLAAPRTELGRTGSAGGVNAVPRNNIAASDRPDHGAASLGVGQPARNTRAVEGRSPVTIRQGNASSPASVQAAAPRTLGNEGRRPWQPAVTAPEPAASSTARRTEIRTTPSGPAQPRAGLPAVSTPVPNGAYGVRNQFGRGEVNRPFQDAAIQPGANSQYVPDRPAIRQGPAVPAPSYSRPNPSYQPPSYQSPSYQPPSRPAPTYSAPPRAVQPVQSAPRPEVRSYSAPGPTMRSSPPAQVSAPVAAPRQVDSGSRSAPASSPSRSSSSDRERR